LRIESCSAGILRSGFLASSQKSKQLQYFLKPFKGGRVMAHPEAQKCEASSLSTGEAARYCSHQARGHYGVLEEVYGNLRCQAHKDSCVVPEAGTHGGERLHLMADGLRCENHGGGLDCEVNLVELMMEVAQAAEAIDPLPPAPTPRSRKNIPQRGRDRVKKR
jgi:hypothetical protein